MGLESMGSDGVFTVCALSADQADFGRMNDPTSAACVTGPCGDEMEFYLVIENDTIVEIRWYTDGCCATKACAAMAAKLVRGKTVREALMLAAGDILAQVNGLPEDHLHCSILAVSTVYRAIAEYLLQKGR